MKQLTSRAARLAFAAAFVMAAFAAAAQDSAQQGRSLASLLSADTLASVTSSGRATHTGSGSLALLPRHAAAAPLRTGIERDKPSLVVEAVFALKRPKPASAAAEQAELASIYGILRSLGSLQGIEYYSASRQKVRTFYAESYIISGPEAKDKIADPKAPTAGAIPAEETVYAFQRDLSFGANRYRYEYTSFPDAITLSSSNLTRMSYGIIPVAAPGELTTRLLVIQADDAILFYAASGAKAPGLVSGKLEDSFANRAEALFRWFSAQFANAKK
jgi:hypothetical protein